MRCLHGYGTQSKRKPAPAQDACRRLMEGDLGAGYATGAGKGVCLPCNGTLKYREASDPR